MDKGQKIILFLVCISLFGLVIVHMTNNVVIKSMSTAADGCSAKCGSIGMQHRDISCVDSKGNKVVDSFCSQSDRPIDQQSCTEPCTARSCKSIADCEWGQSCTKGSCTGSSKGAMNVEWSSAPINTVKAEISGACAAICSKDPTCKHWSYNTNTKDCETFTSNSIYVSCVNDANGIISDVGTPHC
jgi:hypothetical protein